MKRLYVWFWISFFATVITYFCGLYFGLTHFQSLCLVAGILTIMNMVAFLNSGQASCASMVSLSALGIVFCITPEIIKVNFILGCSILMIAFVVYTMSKLIIEEEDLSLGAFGLLATEFVTNFLILVYGHIPYGWIRSLLL